MSHKKSTNYPTFTDFDEYSEFLQNWDIELSKLEKGKFAGNLFQIFSDEILIHHNWIKGKIQLRGNAPKGFLNFGLPILTHDKAIWKGKIAHEKSLVIYPRDGELECVSSREFYAIDISVSEKLMSAAAKLLEFESIDELLNNEAVLRCNNKIRRELETYLIYISQKIKNSHSNIYENILINELKEIIPQLLIKTIVSSKELGKNFQSTKRSNAIKKLINILNEQVDETFSIPELCTLVGVSQRTLEYCIREKYEITAYQFVKYMRLNKVRKVLRNSETQNLRIADIAGKFGFWHMSNFTQEYKSLFGELPSVTKKYNNIS